MPSDPSGSIAAIVLAAGMSRRMGRFKPLLPFGDRPLIWRVIQGVSETVSNIIVVSGYHAQELEAALAGLNVQFVHNPLYEKGEMLSSVQAGVRSLPANTAAFLVVLGDQPMVEGKTIDSLINSWRQGN